MSGGGTYGAQLLAFPELMQDFLYFDMAPQHGAGYGPRAEVRRVRGNFQCTGGRMVKDGNGNKVVGRETRFWTQETLQAGRFMECEGDVYTVGMPDNAWGREGGFNVYDLQKLVGTDGRETVAPAFYDGAKDMA